MEHNNKPMNHAGWNRAIPQHIQVQRNHEIKVIYHVLGDVTAFETEVNEFLREGWHLQKDIELSRAHVTNSGAYLIAVLERWVEE